MKLSTYFNTFETIFTPVLSTNLMYIFTGVEINIRPTQNRIESKRSLFLSLLRVVQKLSRVYKVTVN